MDLTEGGINANKYTVEN